MPYRWLDRLGSFCYRGARPAGTDASKIPGMPRRARLADLPARSEMHVTVIVDGKVRLSGHNHRSIAGQWLVQDQEPDGVVRLLQTTCSNA